MKVVIIGGVAGGATAAARLRRMSETAQIIMFERGPHVSFANCGLPYFVGGEIVESKNLLLHTPESLNQRFKLDVRVNSVVTKINREEKTVSYKTPLSSEELKESYDKLIISTGAAPIHPKIPGIESKKIFSVRDVPDVEKIKEFITNHNVKSAAIVGAGFIGLEMAEQMHRLGLELSIVQSISHVLNPIDVEMADILHKEIIAHGIKLYLSDPLASVEETSGQIIANLKSGQQIKSDMLIMAIGVRPESDLAEAAGLELGIKKAVKVNDYLQTSDPDIYAIGDCIEVKHFLFNTPSHIALAGPANRQARIVADNICGADEKYRGTLGTAVLRLFNLTVASTGLSEEYLKTTEIRYHKIYLHPSNRVTYYPGASTISIKLIFDEQGKILGAQAVGKEGVDKRIDVLATAIIAGMNVVDLKHLELSYAPPYGSAKDPVNLAGMMAENILTSKYSQVHSDNLPEDAFYLDVRDPGELKQGTIKEALNIPLKQLRSRLSELPKDREIVVYCQSGQRSYFATRLLMQYGFKVKNLSGAYKTYSQFR